MSHEINEFDALPAVHHNARRAKRGKHSLELELWNPGSLDIMGEPPIV
jgi:hypothetical protein